MLQYDDIIAVNETVTSPLSWVVGLVELEILNFDHDSHRKSNRKYRYLSYIRWYHMI